MDKTLIDYIRELTECNYYDVPDYLKDLLKCNSELRAEYLLELFMYIYNEENKLNLG